MRRARRARRVSLFATWSSRSRWAERMARTARNMGASTTTSTSCRAGAARRARGRGAGGLRVSCRGYTGKADEHFGKLRAKPAEGILTDVRAAELAEARMLAGPTEPLEVREAKRLEASKMLRDYEAQRMREIPDEPFKMSFVLKFVWTDKVLGVALNQANRIGQTPMSPYYFWPREDAWECVQKVRLRIVRARLRLCLPSPRARARAGTAAPLLA